MASDANSHQQEEVTATELYRRLRNLPPSSKLIYYVLDQAEQPFTASELCEETLLPSRTLRYGVNRLEEEGLIIKHRAIHDPQKDYLNVQDVQS